MLLPSPQWAPDASGACSVCAEKFTALRRRHHCRNCGQLCCAPCSPDALALPTLGLASTQRVCRPCAAIVPVLTAAAGLRVDGNRVVPDESFAAIRERIRAAQTLTTRVATGDRAVFVQQGGLHALLHLAMSPIAEVQLHACTGLRHLASSHAVALLSANALAVLLAAARLSPESGVHGAALAAVCELLHAPPARRFLGSEQIYSLLLLVRPLKTLEKSFRFDSV